MNEIKTVVQDPTLVRRRRVQIADAALRVFTKRGFHRSTIRQIAKEAGIAVGSVYDYIGQKEDLLQLIYTRVMRAALTDMRAATIGLTDPMEALQALIRANIEVVVREHDFFLLMYQDSGSMTPMALERVFKVENEYVGLYQAVLRAGIKQGVFRDLNVKLTAVLIAFMCSLPTLKGWNLHEVTVAELTDEISKSVLQGIPAEAAGPTPP